MDSTTLMNFSRQINLLLVEDDEHTRTTFAASLSRHFKHIREAANGEIGLEMFTSSHVDIVITDLNMPRMDGLSMIEEMQKSGINPKASYVIITAFSDENRLFKAIELGVHHFVTKPIKTKFLMEKLRDIVRSKASEELFIQNMILDSKTDLLMDIAHHWRQPLNTIGLNAQLVQAHSDNNTLSKEFVKEQVEKIMHHIYMLSDTIDNFRTLHNHHFQSREFSIRESAQKAQELICLYADDKQCCICNIEEDAMISGVPELLTEVFITLYKNAVDFAKTNRIQEVRIETDIKINEDKTTIRVSDNAGGIDNDIIHKIFDPYFTTKYNAQDVGVSLFLAKNYIETHFQGTINASNNKEGADFIIEIPI